MTVACIPPSFSTILDSRTLQAPHYLYCYFANFANAINMWKPYVTENAREWPSTQAYNSVIDEIGLL